MPRYTLKTFDRLNALANAFDFAAADDHEAEAAVRAMGVIKEAHELWCKRRWLQTWPSCDPAA